MFELLTEHQFWTAVVIYWIFSAAVSSMPYPAGNGSSGYLWLYRFLHTIAGNITTAFSEAARYRAGASREIKIPGLKTFTLLLVTLLPAATSACAARYTIHPGALNKTDSAAYDILLVAETAIDQARLDYKSGHLPAGAKPAFEALVQSYNITPQSYLASPRSIATNAPAALSLSQVNVNPRDRGVALQELAQTKLTSIRLSKSYHSLSRLWKRIRTAADRQWKSSAELFRKSSP